MSSEVANTIPAAENKQEETTPVDNAVVETSGEGKNESSPDTDAVNAQEKAEETNAASEDTKKETESAAAGSNNKSEPAPKCNVHKTNFEKDMIYLYQFSRTPLLPSLSPYCLKVETWLRLAGLKYEVCVRSRY